jgi:hypothetical protein
VAISMLEIATFSSESVPDSYVSVCLLDSGLN